MQLQPLMFGPPRPIPELLAYIQHERDRGRKPRLSGEERLILLSEDLICNRGHRLTVHGRRELKRLSA